MTSPKAVAGSKIYIGTRVASKEEVDISDFAAQEPFWKEITGWITAGSVGDTQEIITQNYIDSGRTRKIKGTRSGASMENAFSPKPNDLGQIQMKAAEGDNCSPYAFKVEWSADCAIEGIVTIDVATPGIVTWAGGHGLEAGTPVIFTGTGGALPTGLTSGTTYYVVEAGLTPTTFSVAATPGGAAIATTAAGTATSIVATAQPVGTTDLFYGLVLPGTKSGGDANTVLSRSWTIEIDSNIVEV